MGNGAVRQGSQHPTAAHPFARVHFTSIEYTRPNKIQNNTWIPGSLLGIKWFRRCIISESMPRKDNLHIIRRTRDNDHLPVGELVQPSGDEESEGQRSLGDISSQTSLDLQAGETDISTADRRIKRRHGDILDRTSIRTYLKEPTIYVCDTTDPKGKGELLHNKSSCRGVPVSKTQLTVSCPAHGALNRLTISYNELRRMNGVLKRTLLNTPSTR